MASVRARILRQIQTALAALPEFRTVQMVDSRRPEAGGNTWSLERMPIAEIGLVDDIPLNRGPHSGLVERTMTVEIGLYTVHEDHDDRSDDEVLDELVVALERVLLQNDKWGVEDAVHLTYWDGWILNETDGDALLSGTYRLGIQYDHIDDDPEVGSGQ